MNPKENQEWLKVVQKRGGGSSAISTVGSHQLQDRELGRGIRKDRTAPEKRNKPRNPVGRGRSLNIENSVTPLRVRAGCT